MSSASDTHDPEDATAASPPATPLRMRTTPEDFRVIEEPLYPPTGEGDHTFVCIEKRGRTTEQVARDLAQQSGVAHRDIGYAGRKDRHAVTQQWFSLFGVDPERVMEFELEDARVLEAHRHGHKLRTGHLRGNRFEIALRGDSALDSPAPDSPALDSAALDYAVFDRRVEDLLRRGLPNRFGDQRFGRDGSNADKAREMLFGGKPPRDKRAARFLVSALQSEVFNAVLDARADAFDGVMLGDVARVEESGGLFWVDDPEHDAIRARDWEISATGPIFGKKMRAPRDEAAALEAEVWAEFDLPPADEIRLPRGVRANGTRRPLRIRPAGLEITPLDEGTGLSIACSLPSGAYVTVLIEALVGAVEDLSRVSRPTADTSLAVYPDENTPRETDAGSEGKAEP